MMVELARGEVGLIISGFTFVSPEGQSAPAQMSACREPLSKYQRERHVPINRPLNKNGFKTTCAEIRG